MELAVNARSITSSQERKPSLEPSDLLLTAAGFEQGAIHVVQQHLIPQHELNYWRYKTVPVAPSKSCKNDFVLSATFECSLAGLTSPAEEILGADRLAKISEAEPSVKTFLEARLKNTTSSLTLDDLERLGRHLKDKCSEATKEETVGGPTQIAVLADGRISKWEQPNLPLERSRPKLFSIFNGLPMHGSNHPSNTIPVEGGILVASSMGALVTGANLSDIIQPLDNIFFEHSEFQNCILTYSGSPMSIFGIGNRVENSELRVSPETNASSGFLGSIRRNYPGLKITVAKPPNALRWQFKIGN